MSSAEEQELLGKILEFADMLRGASYSGDVASALSDLMMDVIGPGLIDSGFFDD